MKIGVSIMAHTKRAAMAMALADTLGDAEIAWDNGELGEVRCGDRAWQAHEPSTDWWIVLQDDAQPVDGFLQHAADALACAPEHSIVSFYTGKGRPIPLQVGAAVAQAQRRGAAWIAHHSLLWGVGVAMPTRAVPVFLRWGEQQDGLYDKRLSRFAQTSGATVLYTQPSLVDHADGPSLLTADTAVERKAWRIGVAPTYKTGAVAIR